MNVAVGGRLAAHFLARFCSTSASTQFATDRFKVTKREYSSPVAAKPSVGSKVVPAKEDKSFVETDAEKICKFVCINYFIQGEEPGPPILPDSEYPEWLFQLDLRRRRELEDLDPEKDGWVYWSALRKRQIEQSRRIAKLRTRFIHIQNSPSLRRPR